jgi:hypothetical protein
MIQLSRLFIACGLAGAATFGCSGDDTSSGSGAGALSSGLPKDETVGALSDADAQKLWHALAQYVASDPGIRSAECRLAGIGAAVGAAFLGTASDTDLENACTRMESACLNASPNADAATTTCHKPTGTCDVTVGEFETCLSDTLAALKHAVSTLPSCSTLRASDLGTGSGAGPTLQSPASCQVVNQKCPGGLASTGVAGGSTGN